MAPLPVKTLLERRKKAERAWRQRVLGEASTREAEPVREEISRSWRRSQRSISVESKKKVPLLDCEDAHERWKNSPILLAAQPELDNIKALANESNCVAAISDFSGRLMWTSTSRHMETRATDERLIVGGHWDESGAGTNAVGLAVTTQAPCTVFSAEHFKPVLHDWVCYAAPITLLDSGELIGVIDLSSTWDQYNPLAQTAINGLAQSLSMRITRMQQSTPPSIELEIGLLGSPRVRLQGKHLPLSLRHCEILALLAMHPEGISLEKLHAALYGETPVTKTTLKSEISTLRKKLRGGILSRPYRLGMPYRADFVALWQAIRCDDRGLAVTMLRGSLLPQSSAPMIEEWRYLIDAAVDRFLQLYDDAGELIPHATPGVGKAFRQQLNHLL